MPSLFRSTSPFTAHLNRLGNGTPVVLATLRPSLRRAGVFEEFEFGDIHVLARVSGSRDGMLWNRKTCLF